MSKFIQDVKENLRAENVDNNVHFNKFCGVNNL